MKKMLIVVLVILFILLLCQLIYSAYYFRIASKLSATTYSRKTTLGDSGKPNFKLFIAGDSVGAGVGASSFENSVAGRFGNHFAKDNRVEFENISVSGNKVADVVAGGEPAEKQNLIILIVSSNNLFRFTDLAQFKIDAAKLFAKFSPQTDKVLLIGPGRIFDSSAIPLFLRPIYKVRGEKYAKILREEAGKFENVIYVNPFEHQASAEHYGNTFATDKFHPNDSGHRFWFDLIREGLEKS